ncbi:MAG: hypothetical protein AAF637_18385, partial [Pseudomonadota bacterium]
LPVVCRGWPVPSNPAGGAPWVTGPFQPCRWCAEGGRQRTPVGELADRLSGDEIYEIRIGGRSYQARLQSVIPSLNANTRSVPVIFRLENPAAQVRAGQLARLMVSYQVPMQGYWLPVTALIGGRRGLWNAYVLEPSDADDGLMQAGRRELQLLHSEVDRVYVRGTLQPAEQVIVSGLHRLVPGQLVRAK